MPRNVSGTYSLPLPPVVPNTVIQSAWANTTTDDIAQGITDSLDRNGRGGMIAPFRLVDGSVLQPAFAFSSETGTGLYRESPGVMGLSVMGVKIASWSGTGYDVLGNFNVTGDLAFTGDLALTGNVSITGGIAVSDPSFFNAPVTINSPLIIEGGNIGQNVDFNGDIGVFTINPNAGALATAQFFLGNDVSSQARFQLTSSAFGGVGGADALLVFTDGASGMSLAASDPVGGVIRFATGGTTQRMIINQGGLVGVGLNPTTLGVRLDVLGTIRSIGGASVDGAGHGLRLLNAAGTHGASFTVGEVSTDAVISNDTGNLLLATAGSNRVFIDTGGKVGIGALPTYGLQVTGTGVGSVIAASDTGGVTAFLQANAGSEARMGTLTNHPLYMVINGSVRAEWSTSGNLSIGVLSPSVRLDVESPTSGVPGIRVAVSSASSQGSIQMGNLVYQGGDDYLGFRWQRGGTELGHLSSVGNLGLGVASAGVRLHLKAAGAGARCRVESSDGGGVIADWLADGSDSAQLGTTSSHPIKLFTAFAIRQIWGAGTNAAIKHVYNSTEYVAGNDPGAVAADIPIGAIVFGQAVISGGSPALSGLGTFVCGSAGQSISWGPFTGGATTTTITHGTWRNIGAQTTGGVGLFQRVA